MRLVEGGAGRGIETRAILAIQDDGKRRSHDFLAEFDFDGGRLTGAAGRYQRERGNSSEDGKCMARHGSVDYYRPPGSQILYFNIGRLDRAMPSRRDVEIQDLTLGW